MRKRITAIEWSRILGEHDAGNLRRGGSCWPGMHRREIGCLNQVRFNSAYTGEAFHLDLKAGQFFDLSYDDRWTPEQFLEIADRWGL